MKPLIIKRLQIFTKIKLGAHKKCRSTPNYNLEAVETNIQNTAENT